MAIYSSRVIWEQHKEPALSAPLLSFVNPQDNEISLPDDFPTTFAEYSAADIITLARQANIVDETDGRLLATKLEVAAEKSRVALIVDAIDDDPYLSSKVSPLLQLREQVMGGIQLCQKVTQIDTRDVHIVVYRYMRGINTNIPSKIEDYQVNQVGGGYPARPSALQVRQLRRRAHLTVGVGAIIHLYRAAMLREKQTSTFITVHGNAVANPMNLEVSFDVTVTEVLERCGLVQDPTRVIVGSPMTGVAVMDTDRTRITPTTRGVLAFVRRKQEFRYSCIGCGRCERTCPAGLNPSYIYRFIQSGNYTPLANFNPEACIACGLCSYYCPSRLRVSVAAIEAKNLAMSGKLPQPESDFSWQEQRQGLRRLKERLSRTATTVGRGLKHAGIILGRGARWLGKKLWIVSKAIGRGIRKVARVAAKGAKWLGRTLVVAGKAIASHISEKIVQRQERRAADLLTQKAAEENLTVEKGTPPQTENPPQAPRGEEGVPAATITEKATDKQSKPPEHPQKQVEEVQSSAASLGAEIVPKNETAEGLAQSEKHKSKPTATTADDSQQEKKSDSSFGEEPRPKEKEEPDHEV